MKMLWVLLTFFAVSCASDHRDSVSNLPSICVIVINAINQEDWATLRKLTKPGMRANDYVTMWENSERAGRGVRVGKLPNEEKNSRYYLDGKTNKVYSFKLENKDGTLNPHLLLITVREEHGRSELVDFSNFGW